MWIGLLLPEKRLCEDSEWGALLLALVTLVPVACAGPISEHTVLHFHKRLIWIGSLSIVEMIWEGDLGQTKGLVFGWGLGLLSPVPLLPFVHTEPLAGAANCCMEKKSDGVLSGCPA